MTRLVLRASGVAAALALSLAGCGVSVGDRPEGPDPALLLAGPPPSSLAAFNFFEAPRADARLAPRPRVEGYELVNALFSDHATKDRHVYLPPGTTIGVGARGVLEFPVGSAILKTFSLAPDLRTPERGARRIETRVLVRRAEGWVAWPYVWNEAGTDAVYSPVGAHAVREVVGPDGKALRIDYRVPNQNQCKTCHQRGDAITPIGPTLRNLRSAAWKPGVSAGHAPAAFDASLPLEPRARLARHQLRALPPARGQRLQFRAVSRLGRAARHDARYRQASRGGWPRRRRRLLRDRPGPSGAFDHGAPHGLDRARRRDAGARPLRPRSGGRRAGVGLDRFAPGGDLIA